jgi:predicted heme/steroid binding protein
MKRRICRWLFLLLHPVTVAGSIYTVIAYAWRQGRHQGVQFIDWCHGTDDQENSQ